MKNIKKYFFSFSVILTLEACGPRVPNSIVNALTHEDDGDAHGGSEDESSLAQSDAAINTYYYENNNTTSKLEIMGKKNLKDSRYGRWTPNVLFPEKFKFVPLKENND